MIKKKYRGRIKIRKNAVLLSFLLLLYGCGIIGMRNTDPKPTREQLMGAEFGIPPTDYHEQLKAYWQNHLVNPVGAIVELGPLHKRWAYVRKNPTEKYNVSGWRVVYGYGACGFINAQNQMGVYMGRKMFHAFFVNSQLLVVNDIPYKASKFCNPNLTAKE